VVKSGEVEIFDQSGDTPKLGGAQSDVLNPPSLRFGAAGPARSLTCAA
jgi:hypothetical protein